MSKYVVDGKPSTFHFDFKVDGELVVPSAASYALTANGGSQIGSPASHSLTITSGETSVNIAISSGENTASIPNEIRYIDVTFTYAGATYTGSSFWYLKPNAKIPVTAEEVRAVLGVTDIEVPDADVDIIEAMFLCQNDVPAKNLQAVLDAGAVEMPWVILAIRYQAAIQVSIALKNRVMQSEQADNSIYARFTDVDFDAIREELRQRYSTALLHTTAGSTPTIPLLSKMATGVDAITGN